MKRVLLRLDACARASWRRWSSRAAARAWRRRRRRARRSPAATRRRRGQRQPAGQGRRAALRRASPASAATRPTASAASRTGSTWAATARSRRSTTSSAPRASSSGNAPQITQVLEEGGIVSKKPGVINMPSWKGVINDAQANAIAAYILAGFPNTGATYDPDPAEAADIYSAYACIDCHGQVGGTSTPSPAPNPKTADKVVPALRNPDDPVPMSELRSVLMEGSIPDPGTKGVIFMPAWGQILSIDQVNTILPYIADGPMPTPLPAPVAGDAAAARRRGVRRRRAVEPRRRRDDGCPRHPRPGHPPGAAAAGAAHRAGRRRGGPASRPPSCSTSAGRSSSGSRSTSGGSGASRQASRRARGRSWRKRSVSAGAGAKAARAAGLQPTSGSAA